jgi:hypothetical protein
MSSSKATPSASPSVETFARSRAERSSEKEWSKQGRAALHSEATPSAEPTAAVMVRSSWMGGGNGAETGS